MRKWREWAWPGRRGPGPRPSASRRSAREKSRAIFAHSPKELGTMIDLYAAGTANGMRARIGLEECGLAYNFHPVDLTKGEQKSPSFLAMNPNGQIPVIVDRDGP